MSLIKEKDTVEVKPRVSLINKRPMDWHLEEKGDGNIIATSTNGETFEGTVAEFNAALKG